MKRYLKKEQQRRNRLKQRDYEMKIIKKMFFYFNMSKMEFTFRK